MDAHLASCPACAAYAAQMRETVRICGVLISATPGPRPHPSLLRALRR